MPRATLFVRQRNANTRNRKWKTDRHRRRETAMCVNNYETGIGFEILVWYSKRQTLSDAKNKNASKERIQGRLQEGDDRN